MNWASIVVTAVLSGGLIGSLVQLLNLRNEAKRVRLQERELNQREPAFAMEAAERSVSMMKTALDKASSDIQELKATIDRLQTELSSMEEKYSELLHTMYLSRYRMGELTREQEGYKDGQ